MLNIENLTSLVNAILTSLMYFNILDHGECLSLPHETILEPERICAESGVIAI